MQLYPLTSNQENKPLMYSTLHIQDSQSLHTYCFAVAQTLEDTANLHMISIYDVFHMSSTVTYLTCLYYYDITLLVRCIIRETN